MAIAFLVGAVALVAGGFCGWIAHSTFGLSLTLSIGIGVAALVFVEWASFLVGVGLASTIASPRGG